MYLLNVGDGYFSWLFRKLTPDFTIYDSLTEIKPSVLNELADWGEIFRSIVQETPESQILSGPICDRLPLESWSQGRVTLLGDAAHPMSPALGQGANTTFEDALELARCIGNSNTITEALTNYQKRRIPRTQLIQTRSALGEMRYYETDKELSAKRMQQQSQMTDDEFQDWLYNYNQLLAP